MLVTGAGSGLGRLIACRFSELGLRVALLGRRAPMLEETRWALSDACPDALVLPADVRDEEQVRAAVARIDKKWGGLQILINNAGLLGHGEQSVSAWQLFECILKTNLLGPALVAECASGLLRPGSVIVNISSSVAQHPTPNALAYGASKAGLEHLTTSLAVRYARRRIRVVGVAPGGLFKDSERVITSEQGAVEAVVYLTSKYGMHVNGRTLVVDDGESIRNFIGKR